MAQRRDPQAIILAHKMDPARRELYVEGSSDRLFLKWISGTSLHKDVLIQEIASVNIPKQSAGGERARLLEFARLVEDSQANIHFLSDADSDRLLRCLHQLPANVWLTDGRDLESYFLRQDCFEKIVKLAIGTEDYLGKDLLASLKHTGRILGCLRVVSETNDLDLPFQRTNLKRYVTFNRAKFTFNLEGYVRALVSNANLRGSIVPNVIEETTDLLVKFKEIPSFQLVHGKDVVALLAEALLQHKLPRHCAEAILRTSFERAFVYEYPNLTVVFRYITQT